MTVHTLLVGGGCVFLAWALARMIRGALNERERHRREQLLLQRMREREEREKREAAETMDRVVAWCRESGHAATANRWLQKQFAQTELELARLSVFRESDWRQA